MRRVFWCGMMMACTPQEPQPLDVDTAVADTAPRLLISQFYYTGAPEAGGTDHYFSDQFIELVNAGDTTLDVSGVMVGDAFGAAGAINPGMVPDSYAERKPEHVFLQNVWRIPEGIVLEPGEHLVLAHDGTNHQPFSSLDLSGADLEAYVARSGGDQDHPTVPNLEPVHYTGGYDWLMTVFGPSVAVLIADAELVARPGPYGDLMRVSVDDVLDGVDTVMDADSGAFKRLPPAVDAGFVYVSGTYTGEAIHRVRNGDRWQDTQDASADFVVGEPTPAQPDATEPGEVTDPTLTLGGGETTYIPLDDEASIELVAGSQGGWHLDVSLRASGFDPDQVALSYLAQDAETDTPLSYPMQVLVGPTSVLEDGDDWVRVADRIVLDINDPADVVGRRLVVQATATVDGAAVSDTKTWVVVDDE
jgi:hypothetical protein